MTIKNMNSDETYTTKDLYKAWQEYRIEDPSNHSETFKEEMIEIIMATINGRNDLTITDYTPNEIARLIRKLTSK